MTGLSISTPTLNLYDNVMGFQNRRAATSDIFASERHHFYQVLEHCLVVNTVVPKWLRHNAGAK